MRDRKTSIHGKGAVRLLESQAHVPQLSFNVYACITGLRGSDGSRLYASYPINLICILSFYVPLVPIVV